MLWRRFATLVRVRPVLHSGFRSMSPSRSPPFLVEPIQEQNPNTIGALIGCNIPKNQDQKVEKMFTVKALEAAAKSVQRKSFRGLKTQEHVYVNAVGGKVLDELSDLRVALEELKADFREEKEKTRKEKEETRKEKEETRKEKEETRRWQATMKPIQDIAIAIRCRFYSTYRRGKGGKVPPVDRAAILSGNKVAHHGDVVTDVAMIMDGFITDIATFEELYGIPCSGEGSNIYLGSSAIIKMVNIRATLLANTRNKKRSAKRNAANTRNKKRPAKWNAALQKDFEKVLLYFKNAGRVEREKFDNGSARGLREMGCWLRIALIEFEAESKLF